MKKQNSFQKFNNKLVIEGLLKALAWAFTFGCIAIDVSALVMWLVGFDGLWLSLTIGAVVLVASTPIVYFVKFVPNEKRMAERVDALGLEERSITMLELRGDNSYIAQRQRQDALEHVAKAQVGWLKIAFPKVLAIISACALVSAGGASTVLAITEKNIIPGGDDIFHAATDKYVSVFYVVEEGGDISGETDQIILLGSDATPVIAVAEDGWVFYGWDDGVQTPYREDLKITADMTVTAIFTSMADIEGDGDSDDGIPGEGGADDDSDKPSDGNGSGEAEGDGDGSGDTSNEGTGSGEGGVEGDEHGGEGKGEGAGGKYVESNQIIDGNTYYRDVYEQYYNEAMAILAEDGELPDYLKEFIEKYLGSI
jgi:hypothetical protein